MPKRNYTTVERCGDASCPNEARYTIASMLFTDARRSCGVHPRMDGDLAIEDRKVPDLLILVNALLGTLSNVEDPATLSIVAEIRGLVGRP